MSLFKRPQSPYWQIRFKIAGIKVRCSSETEDRKAAGELEDSLRSDLRRKIKSGESLHTWDEAVKRCELEDSHQKSWERTKRSIDILNEYFAGELLTEIDYSNLLKVRSLLELRECNGNGWKTKRLWKPRTVNRVMAVAGSILERCASEEWKVNGKPMLEKAPTIPLLTVEKTERKWVTREQAFSLLRRFPDHTCDMMIVALATGLRKSNVTGLEWARIDMDRAVTYIPGYQTKAGEPIPVPLNADVMAVLERWKGQHPRYVFHWRGKAPIQKVTTAMWRRECKAAELDGVTFHTMRHSWASWQTQAGTPTRILQEMGGWASAQMPQLYSHLDPGHLAQYADRTLLGSLAGVTESVTVDPQAAEASVSPCLNGKGGTRTLDPGIMRLMPVKKAS